MRGLGWRASRMDTVSELIGQSRCMEELRRSLKRLVHGAAGARRPPPILIQGETGTGKGLLARALHQSSTRSAGPFVDINCAAIPDTLLESELFGYERGAFTEARRSKPGLFLAANQGTIFLDEIALLPIELQAKLLKVIEDRTVRRLGATRAEPVDVWILSATNDNVTRLVAQRQFREDLYHRLSVVALTIPPLREREQDVVHLAEHFLARTCADYGLSPRRLCAEARARLLAYPCPGNVRELSNVIERATVLSDSPEISAEALKLSSSSVVVSPHPDRPALIDETGSLQGAIRDRLVEALQRTGGNISRTAAILGVTRATVRSHVRRFGLSSETASGTTRPRAPGQVREKVSLAVDGPAAKGSPLLDEAGPLRWESRFVVTVRMCLAQGSLDAWSESGRLIELAIHKIRGFGGVVQELSPGTLEASFGVLPVDEASRLAGHAALAILTSVDRIRLSGLTGEDPGIVIHADHALVGRLGGGTAWMDRESRERFTQRLDPLVALLQPGHILITPSAAQVMRRRFVLEDKALIDMAPPHYRLLGQLSDGLGGDAPLTPFVGRDQEMDRLRSHAAAALRGEVQVVGLDGEPGVGKSRLIRQFVRQVEDRPWRVLQSTCDGGEQALYHMAVGLLRSYFGVRARDAAEHVRSVIRDALVTDGEDRESVHVPVESLLGVLGDDPSWNALDPNARRQRTEEAFTRLVGHASKLTPVLIVIEDAHWIDAESEALLSNLVSALTMERVLVIVSYRPEYQPRSASRPADHELRVARLAEPVATKLLDGLLGPHDSLLALKRQLVEWTGGNPFFLEESVRSLTEAGVLVGTRGDYVLSRPVTRMEVPATVEGILAVRIDRLPPAARHVVQTAAVIGHQVPSRLLAAVAGVTSEELTAATTHLCKSEFLIEQPADEEVDFIFKHALTHEVARLALPPVVRIHLHRAILREVERLYGDAADERMDLLAHHAVGGEVWEKAVGYLNRTGQRALASAATQRAVECFDQALAVLNRLPDSSQRSGEFIDLHLHLRDALWPLGRVSEVFAHLRDAEDAARRVGDVRRQGWIACHLCQCFWAIADHARALEMGDRAGIIARELGDIALAAESGFYRGLALLALGRLTAAEAALTTSVEDVDAALAAGKYRFPSRWFWRNGPAIVRGFLAVVLADLGRFPEGEAHGQAAIQLAEAPESPFALVAATAGLGSLYVRKGEPSTAIRLLERGLSICRTYRLNNWLAHLLARLGRAYLDAGRVGEGLALLEESIPVSEQTGIIVDRSLWLTYLGEGYLAAGQAVRSKDVAEEALKLARSRGERGHEASALRLMGVIQTRREPVPSDTARSTLQQALALA